MTAPEQHPSASPGRTATPGQAGLPGARQPDAVAGHLAVDVPKAAPGDRAGELRRALLGRRLDSAAAVAVLDGGDLVGLLGFEDLLAAPEGTAVAELMDPDPVVVGPGTDQEVAAWRAARRGVAALAVVDGDGRFLGLVPAERLLPVLVTEHEEDLARLGGVAAASDSARRASIEPVRRRLGHRLPWLLAGLAGAVLSADLVGAFEAQLERTVLLAFFVPGIVYMADAVGTQTETVVIRGLSIGVSLRGVARRELLSGALIGLLLAAVFVPVGLLRWGDARVIAAVALSLWLTCSIATLVAMVLPWLLHRLGRDPAFGSGPLATVIQDLLSVLTYFLVAGLIVR